MSPRFSSELQQFPNLATGDFSSTPIYAGGQEEKNLITTQQGMETVSFVQRPFDPNFVKSWEAFKNAGMPVVPMLRAVEIEGRHVLLTTDLKADGSELYGINLNILMWRGFDRERPPLASIDRRFLQLTHPENIGTIKACTEIYAEKATQYNLMLARDDAFQLLVGPDWSWSLWALDLTHSDSEHTSSTEALSKWNIDAAHESVRAFGLVRNTFLEHGLSEPGPSMSALGKLVVAEPNLPR